MTSYIVTIKTQLETYNIRGISRDVLNYIIEAYYNEDVNLKLGGSIYSMKGLISLTIHEFSTKESLELLDAHIHKHDLYKTSLTGKKYIPVGDLDRHGYDVSMKLLPPDRSYDQQGDSAPKYNHDELQSMHEALDEILERLSKIELGQQITYDDLKEDLELVHNLIGKLSKKDIKQLILGKLIDAGLGAVAGNVIEALQGESFLGLNS